MKFNFLVKSMELALFKWITAVVILITTFIGSVLPIFIKAKKWTARLETMAGGVFLGAGLAHLLADSFEELEDIKGLDYPLAPAVALAMFVFLTVVELFSYSEHDAHVFENAHGHDHGHGHSHEKNDMNQPMLLNSQTGDKIPNGGDLQYANLDDNQADVKSEIFGHSIKNLTVATISLYIIMDVHSLIEGLALGILDSWSNTIAIFCAIIGHKPVEAFALSVILFKDKPLKLLFWILIVIYVLMSPAGIAAGIYLNKIGNHLLLGIIAGISAGTFLFVGCHEWAEMFEHKNSWPKSEKFWHLGLFAFGVLWMLLIAIVETLGEED